jgi:hypothetical protein
MATPYEITPQDIMPMEAYVAQRSELRKRIVALKKPRRIDVGPYATFYFENYETMLQQIQEMLYIEKGGDEQIADELAAYNPMIPQGKELTVTLMFEIDDPARRGSILRRLTDVELTAYIEVAGEKVFAVPEQEVERTASDGKTSSVHFLHFPFPDHLIEAFCSGEGQVILGIGHENYAHMTILSADTRASLGADFAS